MTTKIEVEAWGGMKPRKTYTAQEALILAAQKRGRVFVDKYGQKYRVSANGTLQTHLGRWQDASGGAFSDRGQPFTDPNFN